MVHDAVYSGEVSKAVSQRTLFSDWCTVARPAEPSLADRISMIDTRFLALRNKHDIFIPAGMGLSGSFYAII
jgi:hypothetical protein